jgi:hypothetical protein
VDPDPGGPKICGSGGSGSGTLLFPQYLLQTWCSFPIVLMRELNETLLNNKFVKDPYFLPPSQDVMVKKHLALLSLETTVPDLVDPYSKINLYLNPES